MQKKEIRSSATQGMAHAASTVWHVDAVRPPRIRPQDLCSRPHTTAYALNPKTAVHRQKGMEVVRGAGWEGRRTVQNDLKAT